MARGATSGVLALFLYSATAWQASGSTFLAPMAGELHAAAPTEDEFREALDFILGCGGPSQDQAAAEIGEALKPMWRTMPLNENGKVSWRSLRYLVHRFFIRQSSVVVRGFEPVRPMNSSHIGAASILTKRFPALVDLIANNRVSTDGFKFEEVVALISLVQDLISHEDASLLEIVYKRERRRMSTSLRSQEAVSLLEAYIVHWMLGKDSRSVPILLGNRSLLERAFPHWQALKQLARGSLQSLDFQRLHQPQQPSMTEDMLRQRYSFADISTVASDIRTSFSSYWEPECQAIKEGLVALDRHGTGRVRLVDFYAAKLDGEWRYGESEAYLRELGALDETSPWQGKQVLIANYVQGASNCIVGADHYLVCCVNECDPILAEIEDAVMQPTAAPEQILEVLANMSDFGYTKRLPRFMRKQLLQVAEHHGGEVPLHGRLFAQWMHYAFPQECPFPHKTGTSASLTPSEFGSSYIVSDRDAQKHANASRIEPIVPADVKDAFDWMSQWSHEEELLADYVLRQTMMAQVGPCFGVAGLLLVVLILLRFQLPTRSKGANDLIFSSRGASLKPHIV